MTAVEAAPTVDGEVAAELARRLVNWLETGVRPESLFTENVFVDLTLPHWRVQTQGADAAFHLREDSHPWVGKVRVESLDRTSRGFLIQFEERWTDTAGRAWYCREMMHGKVVGERVGELVVSCTGDWDEARQRLHADQVRLIRP